MITDGPDRVGTMVSIESGGQVAVWDLADIRRMLIRADAIPAHPSTRLMVRLMALTMVGDKNLRYATPAEFEGMDGPEPVWLLPAVRTKTHGALLYPLSRQSVETVKAALGAAGKRARLVFPSPLHPHRPMSDNAIKQFLRRAGYNGQDVLDGARAAFASSMKDKHPQDRAIIDLMLAHPRRDRFEVAYNSNDHTGRRRALAQIWADLLLDGLIPAGGLLQERQR
jgi:hypothetical protein